MAVLNLGRIGFVNKGAYDNATAYKINDIVTYNGSVYSRKVAGTGNLPTDTGFWDLWVSAVDASAYLLKTGGSLTGKLGFTEVDKGTVSTGTVTFTQSAGNVQRLQVGGALTIATTGWDTSGVFSDLVLKLVNAGSATVTLPTINWIKPDGTMTTTFSTYLTAIARPALQTSGTDFMYLFSDDAGTTVYGKLI